MPLTPFSQAALGGPHIGKSARKERPGVGNQEDMGLNSASTPHQMQTAVSQQMLIYSSPSSRTVTVPVVGQALGWALRTLVSPADIGPASSLAWSGELEVGASNCPQKGDSRRQESKV